MDEFLSLTCCLLVLQPRQLTRKPNSKKMICAISGADASNPCVTPQVSNTFMEMIAAVARVELARRTGTLAAVHECFLRDRYKRHNSALINRFSDYI